MTRRRARKAAPPPTRAVAYLRVSTDKQAEHGVSLEDQRERLELYAKLHDLQLVALVVDSGVSAKSLDRPGLTKALGKLETGEADALVVTKLDRLTRSVRDLGELVESYFAGDWALLSVGEQVDTRTAAGRLVLNVLGSVSQWEREAIGERTSQAMQHKIGRGEYTGGPIPYGYKLARNQVKLVQLPAEQKVLRVARSLRKRGQSLRAVADELHSRGHLSRTGKPFAAMQVARMVV